MMLIYLLKEQKGEEEERPCQRGILLLLRCTVVCMFLFILTDVCLNMQHSLFKGILTKSRKITMNFCSIQILREGSLIQYEKKKQNQSNM